MNLFLSFQVFQTIKRYTSESGSVGCNTTSVRNPFSCVETLWDGSGDYSPLQFLYRHIIDIAIISSV